MVAMMAVAGTMLVAGVNKAYGLGQITVWQRREHFGMLAGGASVAKDTAQGTVWRSLSPHNFCILQMREETRRKCSHSSCMWRSLESNPSLAGPHAVFLHRVTLDELALLRGAPRGKGSPEPGSECWPGQGTEMETSRAGLGDERSDPAKASPAASEGSSTDSLHHIPSATASFRKSVLPSPCPWPTSAPHSPVPVLGSGEERQTAVFPVSRVAEWREAQQRRQWEGLSHGY